MDEYLKKLIEENLELTKEIHKMTKKVNRYMLWAQIFGFLKLLIIVIPIILAIMYLPPLLQGIFEQYKSILGISNGGDLIQGLLQTGATPDLKNIDPSEIQKYLK